METVVGSVFISADAGFPVRDGNILFFFFFFTILSLFTLVSVLRPMRPRPSLSSVVVHCLPSFAYASDTHMRFSSLRFPFTDIVTGETSFYRNFPQPVNRSVAWVKMDHRTPLQTMIFFVSQKIGKNRPFCPALNCGSDFLEREFFKLVYYQELKFT